MDGRRESLSPGEKCSICLSNIENRSLTDGCFHAYCFICIKEWSKLKNTCPLCKQPFLKIVHNIRADNDYDEYEVKKSERPARITFPTNTANRRSYRMRTMAKDFRLLSQNLQQLHGGLTTLFSRSRWNDNDDDETETSIISNDPSIHSTATSSFRRYVYRMGLWSQGVHLGCIGAGKVCNVSANYLKRNPACCHRLAPWLNRELNSLLGDESSVNVENVLQKILSLIKVYNIENLKFYEKMKPIFKEKTRHFIHEFFTFAKSSLSMEVYDKNVVYSKPTRIFTEEVVVSDEDGSVAESSYCIEVKENTADYYLRSKNKAEKKEHSRNSRNSRNRNDINFRGDSLIPSTSGLSNESLPIPSTSSQDTQNFRKSLDIYSDNNRDDDDEDEDVKVLGVEKSWKCRSPIFLESSSDNEDDDGEDVVAENITHSFTSDNKQDNNGEADDDSFIQCIKVIEPKTSANNKSTTIKTSVSMNGFKIKSAIKIIKSGDEKEGNDEVSSKSNRNVFDGLNRKKANNDKSNGDDIKRVKLEDNYDYSKLNDSNDGDCGIDDYDDDDDDEKHGKRLKSQIGLVKTDGNLFSSFKKHYKGHKNGN